MLILFLLFYTLPISLIVCWCNYDYQCHFFSIASLYLQLDIGLGCEMQAVL